MLNVDPLPAAEGITGNIIAKGNIGTIFSTGPIGPNPSGAPVNIRAGGGIEQIRTSPDSPSADPLVLNINANVGTGVDADGHYLNTLTLSGDSKLDSPLGLLQTAGDFEGDLKLTNLAVLPTWPSSAPAGILVGGRLAGNIDIRHNLDHSKIIARNMSAAFFNIGLRMTGAIVEFRRDQGDRTLDFNGPTFTIGYGTPPTEYASEIRGMTGANCPPVDMAETDRWFETPDCDGRTFDSLIRFSSTKGIDIRRMTLEITPNTHKAYIPRVEFIAAREMRIGTNPPEADASMEAGVVWSGDLLDGVGGNDPSNDYAEFTINGPIVSAVSPTADLWLKGAVQHPLTVLADLLGEAHLPALDAGQLIRIGEKLGDRLEEEWGCFSTFLSPAVQPCSGQGDVDCKYPCALNAGENSPRAFNGGVQLSPVGRILIVEDSALSGQVIVNQSNTISPQEDAWTGHIVVGTDSYPPITLRPDGSRPDVSPYYARPSVRTSGDPGVARLGGGAVGLAAFHLHDEDREPPNGQTGPTEGVPAGAFFQSGAVPVVFRHYGPVMLNAAVAASWSEAFIVEAKNGATCERTGMGTNGLFQVSGPGDSGWSDARATGLSKLADAQPKSGIFRLRPVPGAILCDMVSGNPEVIWDRLSCDNEPSYEFRILPDCDLDGVPDSDDPDFIFCPVNFCAADYDNSGYVSVQDIFTFLDSWFNNHACADFNGVGGRSIQDLFDFLGAFFAAPSGALCDPAALPNCPNCGPVAPSGCQ